MERLTQIQRELDALHRDTGKLFSATISRMDELLTQPDLGTWAELCNEIAGSGWHAWESCSEYLRISPALARRGGSERLLRSGRYGVSLCGYSFEPCHAYFKGFAGLVEKDALASAVPIEDAGAIVKARYTHASGLIADYFRTAWQVADDREPEEVAHWSAIAARMADGERADMERFLAASGRVTRAVSWAFMSDLHDASDATGISYLGHFPSLRRYLDQASLEVLGDMTLKYARANRGESGEVEAWMDSVSHALPDMEKVQRRHLVRLFDEIADVRLARSLTEQVDRLPMDRPEIVRRWLAPAIARAPLNFEAAAAFVSLEASSAHELLEKLLGQVSFADCKRLFQLYGEAITGRKLRIEPVARESENFRDLPGTDGTTVYLPEMVGEFPDARDNFRLYKLSLLHQLGYYEFGTFDGPSGYPDFSFDAHFARYTDVRLAASLFQILEDARIDWHLERRYRGAREDIRQLKAHAVEQRSAIWPSTVSGQLLEAMLQFSLDGESFDFVDPDNLASLSRLLQEMSRLKAEGSRLEDTLEALSSCYEILAAGTPSSNEETSAAMAQEDEHWEGPEPVSFRGTLDAGQIEVNIRLEQIEELDDAVADGQETPAMSAIMEPKNVEIEQFTRSDRKQKMGMVLTDQKGQMAQADDIEFSDEEVADDDELGEIVEQVTEKPIEDKTYYYDEWDFQIDDYRRRWCTLFEIRESEEKPEFVDETLAEYRDVALGVRRQLNMLKPEMLRKVKGVVDGEELDLERAVEAVVDRKSGFTPSDEIYVQKQRKDRDVSALFLLDMSASTDDTIPEDKEEADPEPDRSFDEDDFLLAFYGRQQQEPAEPKRRIIDVEKQAVVLMAEALKDLGDNYAVCGFSGYGRERVDFFLCKDFDEPFNQRVKGRIGGIKPYRSTRMGPAIRHATRILGETESRIKALIIISDGYPQDYDYGKDRNSRDYGIRDTTRALSEARQKGVQAFCLTVDPSGHDYLREMCPDQQYMVIQKISQLPNELSKVYRSLTG